MKKIILSLLVIISSSCHADNPTSSSTNTNSEISWADVINVKSDDTLTIRLNPNHTSQALGDLKYDQKFILITGPSKKINGALWTPISLNKINGWVNQNYLTEAQTQKFNETLQCSGTEPFWSLTVTDGSATYSNMIDKDSAFAINNITSSSNHTNRWLFDLANDQGKLFLAKTNACSDDMSERVYSYEISADLNNGVFITGCCNPHKIDISEK